MHENLARVDGDIAALHEQCADQAERHDELCERLDLFALQHDQVGLA